jgi:hypothetical protein
MTNKQEQIIENSTTSEESEKPNRLAKLKDLSKKIDAVKHKKMMERVKKVSGE